MLPEVQMLDGGLEAVNVKVRSFKLRSYIGTAQARLVLELSD